ncbi:DNA helicase UvrD [Deinococcus psychrotolerans]|uniref:DNA helicase UvrD n=1 Tax=Deinococcus psychrotolerans TaxID=2489213 RepID=A0A3G8YFH2_9DEIO|nr:UvrD-helicase domain-containing protein [Deinococcus psychrotolerans]AZI44038.1 DNA helicase UvrD [Deinococcus psychrotolerans]
MTRLAPPPTIHPDFEAEASHLSGTVSAMLRQIDAWEDRDRTNGADLETSMVMQDTAEEHAAMLSPHVSQPFFGALTVRIAGKTQALYVGNHAFKDLKGPHSVLSWESEVGGLFYAQTLNWQTPRGLTGTILRRRQLDVRDKALHGVTDLYDAATGETGGREAVLLKRLSEAATAGMRNVVETLQPEQNEILRASAGEHLCIQGPAGSGKTTMLYHRLAWLLHPERREHRARPEACMVLMPNQVLARYSARILPSLHLEGVTVTTPEAWATSFLGLEKLEVVDRTLTLLLTDTSKARRKAAWRRARALGDLSMLRVVRQYLHQRVRANTTQLKYRAEVSLPGRGTATLTLDTPALQALVEGVLARDPLEGLRSAIRHQIEEALFAQVRLDEDERATVRRQLRADITQLTGKIVTGLLPVLSARQLLSDEAVLRQAAAGILPERTIQVLLSDPLAAVSKPRRSYADVTELPVMLAMAALLDGLGRRVGRELEPYDHLALDEAQDYSPLLYALLTRAARPGHITALGDKNQGIHGYKGVADFGEMQAALGSARLMTLSRTYRSTRQITALSSKVAQTYNRTGAVVGVDRDGEAVLRLTGDTVAALCAQAVKAMQQAGHVNIAVVTRRVSEAEQLAADLQYHDVDAQAIVNEQARYQGQVVVMPVNLAKGLEFDGCIVAGADAGHYDPEVEYEARLLYVSTSRGMHALALVAEQKLHPLLS